MNLKSFTDKNYLYFLLPALALIYFSYSLVHSNYIKYQESASYASSAKHTHILSKLIHNIQIERGLSAGYIVSKDKSIKHNLEKRYKMTDSAYKNLIIFSNEHQQFIKKFHQITKIRNEVLNAKLTFEDEIKYYNSLNKELLNAIALLMHNLKSKSYNGKALIELQKIKKKIWDRRELILIIKYYLQREIKIYSIYKIIAEKENQLKAIFYVCASKNTQNFYKQIVQKETVEKITNLRKKFYLHKLSSKEDAKVWFRISSQYIAQIYDVSSQILNVILADALHTQQEVKKVYIFTIILWILSILSLFFLVYMINSLIRKEDKLLAKIRIASHTFDSHEAIVITDAKGVVLEVNKSFTRITGYDANEIIGNTTSILKSGKHNREFYADMWHQLLTSGKWNGDIYNKRKNGEIYPERLSITAIKNEKGDIINFIAQFYDISDLRSAQQEALYQANHDFLTGLFNRKLLLQRLHEENAKALRHNFIHAFLFIDLDNFKNVNDTYGHHIGDELLIQVSQRMKALLREEDILARMSGDEFAIILVNIANSKEVAKKDAQKKCHFIIDALSQPFIIEGDEIHIGASIGIKIFPDEKNNIEDIINNADKAMYISKKDGKNKCSFYNDI